MLTMTSDMGLARATRIWFLGLLWAACVGAQCQAETVNAWGLSSTSIRLDSNHVQAYSQSWTSGDIYLQVTPYLESWQQLNGSAISTGYMASNNPGSTAQNTLTTALEPNGPGSYNIYSFHWFYWACAAYTDDLGYTTGGSLSVSRPTISGVAAFWWLGGVLADEGYYAQSALTANANGASGTPSWSVSTVSGGGAVSLSCSPCGNNTATSTAPSNGCVYDVTVQANYGGFNSTPFNIAIIKPSTMTLDGGYPADASDGPGYQTSYEWTLTDTCGNEDTGLDQHEEFGSWTDDYYASTGVHNNWGQPTPIAREVSDASCYDTIGAYGFTTPVPTNPVPPLSGTTVTHDNPWTYVVGSQSQGQGLAVYSDLQQWYLDHGRHN